MTSLTPPTPAEIEHLGRDVVAALMRALDAEREVIVAKLGQAALDDVKAALVDLGRLVARKAAGEPVDQEIDAAKAVIAGYAALGALVIGRAADDVIREACTIGGRIAKQAGAILRQFALGLALG